MRIWRAHCAESHTTAETPLAGLGTIVILAAWVGCASPEAARPSMHLESSSTRADADIEAHASDVTADVDAGPRVLEPQPLPTPETAPTSLAELRPWFEDARFQSALTGFMSAHEAAGTEVDAALGELTLKASADVFRTFSAEYPTDTRSTAALFMTAWIDAERGLTRDEAERLAKELEKLAADWPLMADALNLRAARVHLAAGEPERAEVLLLQVAKTPDSIHAGLALDLKTALLVQSGRTDEARTLIETAVSEHPDTLEPASWQRLVDLRPDADRATPRFELARRFPEHPLGKAAYDALELKALAPGPRLVLGRALFEASRYDAMRMVFAPFSKQSPEACEAWILLGRALDRTNRKKADKKVADRAFAHYERALACRGEPRADATFLGGRNRLTRGETKAGRRLLEQHVKEFPERSTADDARLLLTEGETTAKKPATKALLSALRRYPNGDMADSIAWQIVGPHVEKRRWKDVLEACEQVLKASPEDIPGRHGGRYRYWRARALWEVGRKDEARTEWQTVFLKNPLSWYAVLAYSRLVKDDPATANSLVSSIEASPSLLDDSMRQMLWTDVHYRRAVEWARLSGGNYEKPSPFHAFIDAELREVSARARPPGEAWDWAHIEVDQLAGAWSRSMRRARTVESAGNLAFPRGEHASLWKLAYPRPFEPIVLRWASSRGLIPDWIWAVMRVESNFDPTVVSWADAIGIMQIILPTAKSLSRDTPHEPTRDNLMNPAIAIELGTKYLAKLLDRHKVYPLASAGYNAGGGAVSKWRKQFGDVDIDEFVERIPYREANLYAKSVTQTLARYLWLYEGELLDLDLVPIGAPSAALAPTE